VAHASSNGRRSLARENGPHILEWLNALGEFEALSSLASYAYEHTRSVYPELLESGAQFAATAIGHPLLPAAVCVTNDVSLATRLAFS